MIEVIVGRKYPILNGDGEAKDTARVERFSKKSPDSKTFSRVVYVTRSGDRGPFRKKEYICSKPAFQKMVDKAVF